MSTALRFLRGMIYPYTAGCANGNSEFIKFIYEFWGYCVNGTSALQYPGGMADTMSISYSISNTTGVGVTPIVVTTTSTHALFTGQQVTISGVNGNTAANGTYQITVINTTQFSLNSTTGNGAYTGGGTINTTPFAFPTTFTEGLNVLAIGNDGYTANQISTSQTGDAFFTALNSNPFSNVASTLTINQSTNYRTTIAAGSNGASLPQSTINVAATTTASTTITASSNGVSLPTGTINVVDTSTFPSGGYLRVQTTTGTQLIAYTGKTSTTFTGCTGGIGSMTTGGSVSIGFPGSGTVYVTTGAGVQTVTYTGLTGTTFTGCTGGTGTMSTGGAVYSPIQISTTSPNSYANLGSVVVNGVLGNTTSNGTWTVTTPTYNITDARYFGTTIGFPSNNASLPQTTINSNTVAPFTTITSLSNGLSLPQATINVAATASASTTINAGGSLPTATITVVSNVGFPTSGTLNVYSTVSTTIALGSDGAALPQSTLYVASTTGFPTAGTLNVTSDAGIQSVSYTGITPISFTGCSGGTGNLAFGNSVVSATTVPQTVTYTGLSGTTFFTGCSGGVGTIAVSNVVDNTGLFNNFPSAGSVYVTTSSGAQLVKYTGKTATTLTGCTGGLGTMSTNNSVFTAFSPASAYTSIGAGSDATSLPQSTINVAATSVAATTIAAGSNGQTFPQSIINVASTTGFPVTGTIWVTTDGGQQVVNYTGVTATSFTGCSGGSGTMSTGGAVSSGFPNTGYIYVTTSTGLHVVTYTGITGTTFTGCSGGSGTMSTGGPVFISYAPTGTIFITSSTGTYPITYTGTTATTFTGASGGSGTMSTYGSINSSISVVLDRPSTLLSGNTTITAGIGGMPNASSTFTVTPLNSFDNVLSLNGALGAGAYTSGGTLVDYSNFYLNNSSPNGNWTSGGTQQALVKDMTNKALVMWKPGSGSSEDSIYVITGVISPNTIRVNLNTGGTPDTITLHPSFNERSNINYRIVDMGNAQNSGTGFADGNFITLQFNPSSQGLNPGQANSQVKVSYRTSGYMGITLSPGGNWNGLTFPVTGDYQIDAPAEFTSLSGGIYNGGPNGNVAITMAADPTFFLMHYKDINSGDGSAYLHVEIPTRLYAASSDTNPMACIHRGGVFNGSVFGIGTSSGQNFGRGFAMKGTDGTVRTYYSLAKSISGDASPVFGVNLTDYRISFNTSRGSVLASDIVLCLPGVANQYSLGRARIRTIKLTSTPLPLYHRFGSPGGDQFLNIQNGIAIIWDNTILPNNLLYII